MSKATVCATLSFIPILLFGFQNCSVKRMEAMTLDSNAATSSDQTSNTNTPAPIAGNSIEAQAITLLQNKCYACHGTTASGGISQINNPDFLISAGQIIPGNPDGSPIFSAALAGRMPIGSSALNPTELSLLRQWITAGAKKPAGSTTIPIPVQVPLTASYSSLFANVITPKCIYCHSGATAKDGVRLDSYAAVKRFISSASPTRTKLYEITSSGEMPPRPDIGLTTNEQKVLGDWIAAGAPNN